MKSRYSNYAPSLLSDEQILAIARKVQNEVVEFTEDSFCVSELSAVQTHLDHYNTLKNRASDLTIAERTRNTDSRRRRNLSSMKNALGDEIADAEAFPESAKAAAIVLNAINNSPVDHNISYDEESVQLNQLITELERPEIQTAIESIPAVAANYTRLKRAQVEMDELRAAKLEQTLNTPEGRIQVPLEAMLFHIDGILSYIERRALAGNDIFETVANNLETYTDEIMVVARKRQTESTVE